ncbi:hypothetical protein SAMN05443026_3987 [Burkholderia orbicola]|nr:hypothetical protein SAMN05443026_3987 [Burkholderia orbicola]
MAMGRPKAELVLSEDERSQLMSIARSRSISAALVARSRCACNSRAPRWARGVCGFWSSESFKLSTDQFFIEKLRDVVGLYLSPPENALVLCVNEKS